MKEYKQLKNIISLLKKIFPFYKDILTTQSFYKDLDRLIKIKPNITPKELKNKIINIKSTKEILLLITIAMLNYSLKNKRNFKKNDLIHFKDCINLIFKNNNIKKGKFTKKVIDISEEYFNNVIIDEITVSGDVGGGFSTANLPGDARHTPLFNIAKRRNNYFGNIMKQTEKMMNGKNKFKYFEKKFKHKKNKAIFDKDTFTMVR